MVQTENQSNVAETPAIAISSSLARPKLQSKATTAVSLTDAHTILPSALSPSSTAPRSPAASVARSVSRYGRSSPRFSSSGQDDETASIRSFRSLAFSPGVEVESLFGDLRSLKRDESPARRPHFTLEDDTFFTAQDDQGLLFAERLEREFDELEDLQSDASNEVSLMARWTEKLKHYIILSSAGKPIYSRHGDDQLVSNSIGVIQTIISMIQGDNDTLKSFTAGNTRFVIQSKGHLHLVAITKVPEGDAELRAQLEALYMQILSTLTLPSMERMFLNRPSTDLRRPLEGTEKLLSALADNFTRGSPSNLLSAIECLRLHKSQRELINRTMVMSKSANLLYGLVVANGKLVSVIRPKKHSLHPSDLHLIFNMLFNSDGLRGGGGENWVPICLPGFNNTGYLYMYVSFVHPDELHEGLGDGTTASRTEDSNQKPPKNIVFVLISTSKESFYELRDMRKSLFENFKSNGSLSSVVSAIEQGRPSSTDIIPGTVLRHFLYKSRANVQFFMPSSSPDFQSPLNWRKLMSLYSSLHSAIHSKISGVKICHYLTDDHVSFARVTPLSEIYCLAIPTTSRNALVQAVHKLEQWARKEEERIFIIGGAVF